MRPCRASTAATAALDARRVGDVEHLRLDPRRRRNLGEVGTDDGGPLLGEAPDNRSPDARGCPGDQGHLTGQPALTHRNPSAPLERLHVDARRQLPQAGRRPIGNE